ncbi:MAG TPA: lytic transglycosylase domain-containing protein, partial [Phytomonospora sp.]
RIGARSFAVLLLFAGVAAGINLGLAGGGHDDRDTREAAADTARAEDQEGTTRDWWREYSESAADSDAEGKAEELTKIVGEQATTADEEYEKRKKEKENEIPGVDPGAIPDDCDEYSGNRAIGCTLLLKAGFGLDQMPCLDKLWDHESGWNERATNGGSGAYGIPQAYPGEKMATSGSDWQTNPATQIDWGLGYISGRYGDPCGAWENFVNNGSY